MDQKKLIIFTDGGSRGNPGLAGAGVVITDEAGIVLKENYRFLGHLTNNQAEYQAVILGLETAKRFFGKEVVASKKIEIKLDSELVARQLSGQYQIKEKDLWPAFMKIWNFQIKDFPNLSFTYIPREKNKLADRLANKAMDEKVAN
jgi:ribonuclease HI